jgi:hypothetical protein
MPRNEKMVELPVVTARQAAVAGKAADETDWISNDAESAKAICRSVKYNFSIHWQ